MSEEIITKEHYYFNETQKKYSALLHLNLELFNSSLEGMSDENSIKINEFLDNTMSLYGNTLHCFFIETYLHELIDEIASDFVIRNFVLNVAHKLSFHLEVGGIKDELIEYIVKSVKTSMGSFGSSTLLPQDFIYSIEAEDVDSIKELLNHNFYLIPLYLLLSV